VVIARHYALASRIAEGGIAYFFIGILGEGALAAVS
jgi:hypothetical protein